MSRDEKIATAGRQGDLYQGLVNAGMVDTRANAKLAMPGALYKATTGESARLMPKLIARPPRITPAQSISVAPGNWHGTRAGSPIAGLRIRLTALADKRGKPHLAFFLYDKVIVHNPTHLANSVTDTITAAAEDAGRLLFGRFPVNFALTGTISRPVQAHPDYTVPSRFPTLLPALSPRTSGSPSRSGPGASDPYAAARRIFIRNSIPSS
ncbi:hypothetical protein QBC39DRAFT_335338 [Podospora conica]|nr:hypothetical protein QBC39DRAFT_335338 [Schizothecium conicum]